jgi:hypothetical protein
MSSVGWSSVLLATLLALTEKILGMSIRQVCGRELQKQGEAQEKQGRMSNLSPMTRKAQVLEVLVNNRGRWVDGPDLANAEVGGSEGLKRLRELRQEGHVIERRKHPDPTREIYQYRLTKLNATPTGTATTSRSEKETPIASTPVYQPSDPQELVEAWLADD